MFLQGLFSVYSYLIIQNFLSEIQFYLSFQASELVNRVQQILFTFTTQTYILKIVYWTPSDLQETFKLNKVTLILNPTRYIRLLQIHSWQFLGMSCENLHWLLLTSKASNSPSVKSSLSSPTLQILPQNWNKNPSCPNV